MGVIVVVCAVFGLTVSGAKTEIMYLRAKEMPESTATFSVEAAGQVYNQTNEFVYSRGKRQHKCRPVHRGRPPLTQRMLQLPEVHPQAVRPTERSPRAQNTDAKSRGTRDNAVRLRHLEPARVPLRHAALSPPQVLDSLHWLAKAQSRRPSDFLSGHASQDGKGEHRGDFTQEADLVCEICGAHGVYENVEVRDVWRNGGGRGLCRGPGKRVDGVFPGRSQSFRHQRRLVDDCSPGRGGMTQDGRTRGGTFHGEMDLCRENQGLTTACCGMPERDGKDPEEDSPKQAGSCWFAHPCCLTRSVWRELVSSGCFVCRYHDVFFSGVTFVLFCFAFVSMLLLKPRPLRSIVLRYAGVPIATRVFFFFFFPFCLFGDVAFSEHFFVPFPLSLCMESTSYVLSFRMVFFLPCDHGLNF